MLALTMAAATLCFYCIRSEPRAAVVAVVVAARPEDAVSWRCGPASRYCDALECSGAATRQDVLAPDYGDLWVFPEVLGMLGDT